MQTIPRARILCHPFPSERLANLGEIAFIDSERSVLDYTALPLEHVKLDCTSHFRIKCFVLVWRQSQLKLVGSKYCFVLEPLLNFHTLCA
eukprot:3182610-Amphidinium_carterae.2